ncbi:MAG: polysaccharide pyruvyl transferase family protein [Clostridia bacterium]|nr:polysaccharide pyruvyl transferase family protein [Clostridia bacterium]
MHNSTQNIGDSLSPIIVEYMKKEKGINKDIAALRTTNLLAVGSIIGATYQNSVVWGTGLLKGNRKYWWRSVRKLDIRAVRGPETRDTLIKNGYNCPEVYGDPAIILPLIYTPKDTEKEYDYKVVPNYIFLDGQDCILSPLTNDWKSFVDELVKCKLVISSSLHGIILAESYGIPAIMLKSSLDTFKFRDYYYSTGRFDIPIANSVEEALSMKIPEVPDLTGLRQGLIDAFPYDIWKH